MIPVSQGKPYAGNPHVRFEEGASAQAAPRRSALLHQRQSPFHSAATFQPLHRPSRPGLPTLRPRSGQPCSPFETGVLLVRRPARPRFRFGLTRAPHESPTSGGYRRTPVRRRGRVLSKPPRLKGFRPASAPTEAARGHPGRVRRHGLRLSSGASSRNRAFSPSSRRLVRGTSRDTSSARLRLLVSRACRIRDAEPSASNALLQASAPSKPPHQPLRRVFFVTSLRRGFASP